jgi:hypothetical protein
METYDFRGWATKNNLRCSDGRTIRENAFAAQDGTTVPLCWGHKHDDVFHVLGHALLKNEKDGVRAYCKFNNTDQGIAAKEVVRNGDVNSLSIYAGHLKHNGADVMHGQIVEVSLVLAGANPGAKIEDVFAHSDTGVPELIVDEGVIFTGETIELAHDDNGDNIPESTNPSEQETLSHENKEEKPMAEEAKTSKTIEEVVNGMTEEQLNAMAALIAVAQEEAKEDATEMKHNFFDDNASYEGRAYGPTLSHEDGVEIVKLAKNSSVGSLKTALEIFAKNNDVLAHGFTNNDIEALFPEFKDVRPGAPELITRDQGWVTAVMNGVHKSPISRIRTRQMDIRDLTNENDLRGHGYNRSKQNGQKFPIGNAKLLKRTTDPQTVYVKDSLHRDDIVDITDFDVVAYEYNIMRLLLNEELAVAFMIGDGRADDADYKISEDHIRSIWHDDELYTIHQDVDIETMRDEIQGSNTSANFGENYIYAESVVQAALYAKEQYKGSGRLEFYCDPHLLNVMLLARDLNGRRIYDTIAELEKALNVTKIWTAEQFANKTRVEGTGASAKTKKLLGIFVDLNDYHVGATKGGEITKFQDFDIDFNQEKFMLETRLSAANTRIKSAIALEEDVTE